METPEEFIARIRNYIEQQSKQELASDNEDFNPGDSGNFDDAYQLGVDDGRIDFAKELMFELFNKD